MFLLNKKDKFYAILLLNLFLSFSVFGQSARILVADSKTKESIPFAHVCFEELGTNQKHYQLTNKDGAVFNPSKTRNIIAISYIGYETYIDTINPNTPYEILLKPQIFDLDQVVVTASYTPIKADKSIYNIKVIDSRKIELKAASNLSDILKDEINLQVSYDPALGSSLKIKGLSGNNVKILVDGVPVIGRMGGNIDLSQINLYNVDHVEVIEGPMSVIYGSNALAGAINIITKENLRSTFNVSANTYIENLGTYNLDGLVAFRKGSNSFSFAGGRSFFGGVYLDVDQNRSQSWKPKEQYNADFYYTYNKERYKIKFQSSFMNERLLDKGDQDAPSFRYATDSWFKSQRLTNKIDYNQKFSNSNFLNIWGSYTFYTREKLSYVRDFINSTSTLINSSSANDSTKSNAFVFKMILGNQDASKKLNFLTGVDINYEDAIGKRILDNKQVISEYALFTSLLYNVNDKLSIQPGFRYSYYTISENVPVPSLNIKWNPVSFLNIRSSYVRGFRVPSLKELYIQFKDINHDIQPNDSLTSENSHDFDLAFSINTNKSSKIHFSNIDISLFYKQISDHIFLAPIVGGTSVSYKYINISYFNTFGGQLAFKYSFYPNFDFGLSYGLTGIYASQALRNQSLDKYKFSSDASMNASYLFPKPNIKLYLNYKYTGLKWTPDLGESVNPDSVDGIVWETIEKYHTVDISLIKKILSNKLTVTFGVKNLLDNTIVLSTGSGGDAPHTGGDGSPVGYGRLFFTSLSYNLSK